MAAEPPRGPAERSARAIVHEINNQLTVVAYSVQLAASSAGADGEVREHLNRIEASARAVAALVEELRGTGSGDATAAAEPSPSGEPARGAVLIVDDSATLRQVITTALENGGFQVIAARDGTEALDRLREHPELGAMLTDVQMPVMPGPELAARARRERPDLPIVFVTGEEYDVIEFEGGTGPVVRKPFTESELVLALRSALQD